MSARPMCEATRPAEAPMVRTAATARAAEASSLKSVRCPSFQRELFR